MIILKLAMRNIMGTGLRTWLNIIVLSFAYVAIIFNQGFYYGLFNRVSDARIEAELGGGQFRHRNYDAHDLLTLQDAHGEIPQSMQNRIIQGRAVPILMLQATLYLKGRMRPILVKGIPHDQKLLSIPTHILEKTKGPLQALIGARMAQSTRLRTGDIITVQWKDANGTFDAHDVEIIQIMHTIVPTIDYGQIWVSLHRLQHLVQMKNEATILVIDHELLPVWFGHDWIFRDLPWLLRDLYDVEKNRTAASYFLYGLLMMLAMVAIFDTQILSIFIRQKEIGTLISLGMTKSNVVQLFTVEGILHGVLAACFGMLWGFPLLRYFSNAGFAVPDAVDKTGYAIGERLYPVYTLSLVTETVLLVLIVTAIVSYLPTRKIATLKPTDALRKKIYQK
ncbi:ABC transporter permease [bacterium]|nr:ABC transporter permease [bacterium]